MKKLFGLLLLISMAALLPLSAFAVDSSEIFEDVVKEAWYKPSVDIAVEKGLMNGVSDTKFAPEGNTTRAALVTILWRMNGSPEVTDGTPFADLTQDWYKSAVAWAYKNGIVNGVSETAFAPDSPLARDGLVTILYRYYLSMGGRAVDTSDFSMYSDADKINSWAEGAFSWGTLEGIVTEESGILRPTESASRAELAVMMVRFYTKYVYFFDKTENPDEDGLYKSIKCVTASSYAESAFAIPDTGYLLNLRYPAEWSVEKNGEIFVILRNGKKIGEIVSGVAGDVKHWKTVNYVNNVSSNAVCRRYIEKVGTGSTVSFRYRYLYECKRDRITDRITLTIDYSEVNSLAAKWLYLESGFVPKTLESDPISGIYEELNRSNILIIGNSFVNTSRVGDILSEMFSVNNKKCSVNAISRGYATVKTYVEDAYIMDDIRSGVYDVVFICGLYSGEEIINLVTLKEACDKSETKMVLFPAHNESRDVINTAIKKHPEFEILDWKNEIDNFIMSGISKWEFCIDDQHLHSKPLAGYVGAHMIYRSIYGVPQGKVGNVISQKDIDALLGDYKKTGIVEFYNLDTINYFN